jgi:hypothetical protein
MELTKYSQAKEKREKVGNRHKSPQKRSDLCFFRLIILLFNLFCISLHNNSYLKQNGLQQQTPFHSHYRVLSLGQYGACSGWEYGYHRRRPPSGRLFCGSPDDFRVRDDIL